MALAFATIENIFYLEDSNLAISRRSVKALLIPSLIHGVIDGVLDMGRYSWLFVIVGIGLTIVNYVYAIKLIKKAKEKCLRQTGDSI